MLKRIRLWRKRRKLRCPVVLRVTYPADANRPDLGDLEIEVFLGWIPPGEIDSQLDRWLKEIDQLDVESTSGRRRGRNV